MKLTKLKMLLDIDTGAPEPVILCDEHNLFLLYYYIKPANNAIDLGELPWQRSKDDAGVAVLTFKNVFVHKFGYPNDEALKYHRCYSLGLTSYSMFEVSQSDWIGEIQMGAGNELKALKHYIITFKDSTFECIAKHAEITFIPSSSIKDGIAQVVSSWNF